MPATLEELEARYLRGLAVIHQFHGPKFKAAAQELWKIGDQIQRLTRGRYDWGEMQRRAGVGRITAPLPEHRLTTVQEQGETARLIGPVKV